VIIFNSKKTRPGTAIGVMLEIRIPSFLLVILFISVSLCSTDGFADIELQPSPKAPSIPAKEHPESALKGKQKTNQPQDTADYPSVVTPINQPNELKRNAKNDAQKGTNQRTEFYILSGYKFRIADAFLIVFTLALVVCTAILAWVAYRQYKAMLLTQRAFVFLKTFIVHPAQDPNKLIIIPVWENSGTTQTKNLFCHVNWYAVPLPGMPDNFNYPDLGQRQLFPMLIGPKSTIVGAEVSIDEIAVNQVIQGHGRCYIWGWAEYNDIFSKIRHRTEFCYEIVLSALDGGIHPELRIYGPHNGADKQCMKKPAT
jgi:hypothetical protein